MMPTATMFGETSDNYRNAAQYSENFKCTTKKRKGTVGKRKGRPYVPRRSVDGEGKKYSKGVLSTPPLKTAEEDLKLLGYYSFPVYPGRKKRKFCQNNSYSLPRTFSKNSSRLRKFKYNKSSSEDETSGEADCLPVRRALEFSDIKLNDDEKSEESMSSGEFTGSHSKTYSRYAEDSQPSRAYRKYNLTSNRVSSAYKKKTEYFIDSCEE